MRWSRRVSRISADREAGRVRPYPAPAHYAARAGARVGLPIEAARARADGILALALGLARVHITWTLGKVVYFPVVILSGVLLFAAIDLIGGTLCFWTIERTEVMNVFTYGGVFMSSYPIQIYQAWIRRTFTFIVPIAFVAYYPGLYFLGRTDPLGLPRFVSFLTPLVALAFCAVALCLLGVGRARHYQSTGS